MTEFAKKVYKVVARVPRGRVFSYAEVAQRAGRPGAARAVGTLMAKNPFSKTKVPCHRVVRSDGRVGNYSGKGGGRKKIELLKKEGVQIFGGRVSKVG